MGSSETKFGDGKMFLTAGFSAYCAASCRHQTFGALSTWRSLHKPNNEVNMTEVLSQLKTSSPSKGMLYAVVRNVRDYAIS